MASSTIGKPSEAKTDETTNHFEAMMAAASNPDDIATWEKAISTFIDSHKNLSTSKDKQTWLSHSLFFLELIREHLVIINQLRPTIDSAPKLATPDFSELRNEIEGLAFNRGTKEQLGKIIDAATRFYAEHKDGERNDVNLGTWCIEIVRKLDYVSILSDKLKVSNLYGEHLTKRIGYINKQILNLRTAQQHLAKIASIKVERTGSLMSTLFCSVWSTPKKPKTQSVDAPTKRQSLS